MQKSQKFWDSIAEKYAKSSIGDMPAYEYTLDRTRAQLKPGDRVLELGCGTGSTALLLAQNAAQIVATDISPAMLAVGQRNADAQGITNVQFAQAIPATAPDGPFDAVLAFNLLHLVEDLNATLSAIHQRLKPGGLFISKTICTPERRTPFSYRAMMLALPLLQMIGKAPPVRITRIAELERAITNAGFDIIEAGNHPVNPPRRYLIAHKGA